MARRDGLQYGDDDAQEHLEDWKQGERRLQPAEEEKKAERQPRPHEVKRAARLVGVTFPSPAWKSWIRAKAAELGDKDRLSDLLVYCLSYAFAAIESSDLTAPDLERIRSHYRASETLDLFWKPPNEI